MAAIAPVIRPTQVGYKLVTISQRLETRKIKALVMAIPQSTA